MTNAKPIVAVPIKKMVYAFGTQSHIREAFSIRLRDEIKRTPVSYTEIRDGSSLKHLYLRTIIKALCELYHLESNGREKLWIPQSKKIIQKSTGVYELYDAIEIGLFFDAHINSPRPFAYLSIQPSFHLKSEGEITKEVKFEIGKK